MRILLIFFIVFVVRLILLPECVKFGIFDFLYHISICAGMILITFFVDKFIDKLKKH